MSGKPTVYAVVRAVIEVPVRSSDAGETLAELYRVAKQEATMILMNKDLKREEFRVLPDSIEFSHAVVKESK